MEIDLVGMRAETELLQDRLDESLHRDNLRAIHMGLAPLVGQLQGAVSVRRRKVGDSPDVRAAEALLEDVKASSRQVGADIRLASDDALTLGLRTALGEALELIAILERSLH